ncbi:cysteine-rich repeat secretory protein 55 [Ricinus communis]|uniref:cysteine-rich repeat secretory protein 55 n=1 Tax=Ricinus communis TaxID=3988 RepID=UPI0007722EBD|nr:cysteine-rich repeat secretory protein 55 [Ricinus communis]|eukprot:XP_015574224.1 cysteine-rich repeat secretory protein 55 [Ricinus communis]
MELLIIVLSTLMLLFTPSSCADSNQKLAAVCSGPDNATLDNQLQISFNNLLGALATNAPLHNGFYKDTAGRGSNKIYGLTQCRGDLSATNCAACLKNATMNHVCSTSVSVTIWYKWCFIRYSNESFFGIWGRSAAAYSNETDLDDPNVVSQGHNFMNDLVSTAPKQPLMFQTAVLDVGENGKRFGMAQCTRDINSTDCAKCFDNLLVTFRTTIERKRRWEVYGNGCNLRYDDYQFYFNYTLPLNEGGVANLSPKRVAIGMIIPVLMFLLLL